MFQCISDFFFLEIRDVTPPGILVTLATTVCVSVLVFRSCLTLCNPMDCSPPGSSVHGILQARVLEWVAILLQGIFLTQQLNFGLLHHRQILYCPSLGRC